MAAPTQANRAMGVNSPLGDDVLLLVSMTGTEKLGRLPTYQVEVASTDFSIPFTEIIGKRVTIWIEMSDDTPRYWNGFVSRFVYTGMGEDGLAHYHMTVVPWFWLLTRTADCRIFQDLSIPDIVKQIFRDAGQTDFEDRLTGEYVPWNYCVQYRETDFAFVSRLMEQEGMYYYFEHTEDGHTLVMCDDASAHGPHPTADELPYRPPGKGRAGEEFISQLGVGQVLQSGKVELREFDFKKPSAGLMSNIEMDLGHDEATWEIYDFPGEYVGPEGDRESGSQYATLRLQEQHAEQEVVDAHTNSRGLACGYLLTVSEYDPRPDQEREYLVISANYRLIAGAYTSGGREGGGEAKYSCSFQGIDNQRPFRPARLTPKPVIQGPQSAIVVGPGGEEIFTDEFGRIKVQFHWDREGEMNEDSSCWMRVSQPWAGKGWGGVSIPRIGQEVLITFMEGDPDCPIVTGRVYNQEAMPPYELPAGAVQSGLKSNTTKGGGGYNEYVMDDTAGAELIRIHGQFDRDMTIENDNREHILNDESIDVSNNRTKQIGNDETNNWGNDRTNTVGHDFTETVANNETLTVGADRTRNVGKNESITVALTRAVTVGINDAKTIGATQEVTVGAMREVSVGVNLGTNVGKDEDRDVGGSRSTKIGKDEDLKIEKKYVVDAGDEITIKTGKASLVMKKNGDITLKGKNIVLKGSGKIQAKASKDMILKGSKIKAN
jgi:type VI secretion system secreted protein VgrG